MTVPYEVRLSRHAHDLDDNGHDTFAAGFTPVIGYAEYNTPAPTNVTPSTPDSLIFDTFYDVNQSAGSLPAGLGLSFSAGVFTATADGIWQLAIEVDLVTNPGSASTVALRVPNYGYTPYIAIKPTGNPADWEIERTAVMHTGDTFTVVQYSVGSSKTLMTYAVLDIIRIANAVS